MVDSAALRAVALRGVGVRVPPWVPASFYQQDYGV